MSTRATDPAAAIAVGEVSEREVVTVSGRVAAVTVEPKNTAPRLVVRLSDSSGVIDLVFIGRRSLPGVDPGVAIRASGRVQALSTGNAILNPRYDLVAS